MQIDVTELRDALAGADAPVVLDVREPWEIALCALPNSLNIPMAEIPARLAEIPRETPIAVLCHHDRIVRRLDKILDSGWYCHGWSNVADPVSDNLIERAYGPMLDHSGAQTLVIGVTDFGSVRRRWGDVSPPRVAAHIDLFDPVTGELRESGFDPD